MANGKATTASFFENGTTQQFEYCFKLYPQVLKLKAEKRCKKPQELIRLDQWYQNELPKLIKARGKDAHMVYDELVQTMKWKQSRGKFYPQLSYLVKVNTPRAVVQETKKAFRKLPNLEQAITALSNLKGVGTTMASALLAAAAPDSAPFMADECLMAIPEIEGIDYTTKEYLNFVQHIQSTVARLNIEVGGDVPKWSPHRVELALWAHYVANDLNPELLEEMPSASASLNNATNGIMNNKNDDEDAMDGDVDGDDVTKVLDNEDTTNDVDDESFGGGVGADADADGGNNKNNSVNSTTTINTSPTTNAANNLVNADGGDSNFISNDSTSQEDVEPPTIIDEENTTQTTATTSSIEDGVEPIGTPLASDTESNIEAPTQKANFNNKTLTTITTSTAATNATNNNITPPGHTTAAATAEGSSEGADQLPSNNKTNNGIATAAAGGAAAGVGANALVDTAIGNGNGTLSANETSNCLVRSANNVAGDADDLDDDEDDDDEDLDDEDLDDEDIDDEEEDIDDDEDVVEDESNNSRQKKATSNAKIIIRKDSSANSGNNGAAAGLKASPATIGQKRTVLHCTADDDDEDDDDGMEGGGPSTDIVSGEQPELKKFRSD